MTDNRTLRLERTFRAPAKAGFEAFRSGAFDDLESTLEAARSGG